MVRGSAIFKYWRFIERQVVDSVTSLVKNVKCHINRTMYSSYQPNYVFVISAQLCIRHINRTMYPSYQVSSELCIRHILTELCIRHSTELCIRHINRTLYSCHINRNMYPSYNLILFRPIIL